MKTKSLRDLRVNAGFTQSEVAKQTKKTITYIYLLEKGKRNPSDKMKKLLAKLYNVEITDIFLAIELTKC